MGKVDQGVFTHWMLSHHFGLPLRLHRLRRRGQAGSRPSPRRPSCRSIELQCSSRTAGMERRSMSAAAGTAASRWRDDPRLSRDHRHPGVDRAGARRKAWRRTVYLSDCASLFDHTPWRPRRSARSCGTSSGSCPMASGSHERSGLSLRHGRPCAPGDRNRFPPRPPHPASEQTETPTAITMDTSGDVPDPHRLSDASERCSLGRSRGLGDA